MKPINKFSMTLAGHPTNESFICRVISDFIMPLEPIGEDLSNFIAAIKEVFTNCVIHTYPDCVGELYISAAIYENGLAKIKIRDKGCGIENVKRAMEPLYTTGNEKNSGLGFTIMELYCDQFNIQSTPGKGTSVTLYKNF